MDLPAALEWSRRQLSDARDRALSHEIVTGTLRWQRMLDHLAGVFARRPLARIDPVTLTVVRLSMHQILHLDRVPVSAVVDDAVNLVRTAGVRSAAGFVNAVLRTLVRTRTALPLPARPSDPADIAAAVAYLGITHSHPAWLVERWLNRVGLDAAEAWVQFNNSPAPVTLRVNTLRDTVDGVRTAIAATGIAGTPTRYAAAGLTLAGGYPDGPISTGTAVIQDEASQLVTLALGAAPGERILDVCAAPGGKTTAIAVDMDNRGTLIATDVRPRRMALLRSAATRSRGSVIRLVRIGTTTALPFAAAFDRVLVDAPCSGLGTIRRDPDIRWRRSVEDLRRLAAVQIDLLRRAAATVRPGGRLVYATCSSEPEENEDVVRVFLEDRGDFHPIDLRTDPALPDRIRPLIDHQGALRTLPYAHELEAFYAVALRRRS